MNDRINAEGLSTQFWLYPEDRRNIWHFYYFAAKNLHGFLRNFAAISDVPRICHPDYRKRLPPSQTNGRDSLDGILESLELLLSLFEEGDVDDIDANGTSSLIEHLHRLMTWLPYMNERHYKFSRYEYENYGGEVWCPFDEMKHLDRTIARRIAPAMRNFASCSQFPPDYFQRMYGFQDPLSFLKGAYTDCTEWRKTLAIMVDAWEWLANREDNPPTNNAWEIVPDEVYYGLQLFAEYLPEMQND